MAPALIRLMIFMSLKARLKRNTNENSARSYFAGNADLLITSAFLRNFTMVMRVLCSSITVDLLQLARPAVLNCCSRPKTLWNPNTAFSWLPQEGGVTV